MPPKETVKISQDTFDDAVKDNMEVFDMPFEEAIKSAIEEFQLQGGDLSTVLRTPPEDRDSHPMAVACMELRDKVTAGCLSESDIASLDRVAELATGKGDEGSEALATAYQNLGAVHVVTALKSLASEAAPPPPLVAAALRCLTALIAAPHCKTQSVAAGATKALLSLLSLPPPLPPAPTAAALTSVLRHNEDAKCALKDENGIQILSDILSNHVRLDAATLEAVCGAARAAATADDPSAPASKAFTIGRELGEAGAAVSVLAALRQRCSLEGGAEPGLFVPLCDALRAVAVNDEICRRVGDEGGIKTVLDFLDAWLSDPRRALAALSLLRQVCGSDDNKQRAVGGGAWGVVVRGLEMYKESNAAVTEGLLGLSAVLSLRNIEGSAAAADAGFFDGLAAAMEGQAESAAVQRQACMALRNMVVRNPDLRPLALSKGLEGLVRRARRSHPRQCDDVGSAALRDMGLEDYK